VTGRQMTRRVPATAGSGMIARLWLTRVRQLSVGISGGKGQVREHPAADIEHPLGTGG
jgi:hypothetical protein